MNKSKTVSWRLLFGIVIIFLSVSSAYATDNFVKISLPKGVSIELPKNWVVISKDQRITLDTMVESGLDLAGIEQENSDLPFAANYYKNGKTIGIINNRYYPNLDLTQNDARQATMQDINELDAALKENIVKSRKAFGMSSILSWKGTKKNTINGITAFVTEYHRRSLKGTGAFRVRLIRVFAGNRSFTLTVSYNEEESFFLKTITDRIIGSLKLSGIKQSPLHSTKTQAEPTANKDSIMSQVYGDNLVIMLVLSALLTWGIGLTPPLLIRFAFVRRPIGKEWAIGTAAIFWIVNIILFTALGSTSKTHGALFLVAWASYAILRIGAKKTVVVNKQHNENA